VNISDLSLDDLKQRLGTSGIYLRTGPFVTRLRSKIPSVVNNLALLYAYNNLLVTEGFADFHVNLATPRGLRRWYRPQVMFRFDDQVPFKPLPYQQAFPMMEWGLNWCVSNHAHQYLILHSAVVEKDGFAVILPAPPGSGKSTLCAGLVNRGWRLLSDELGLISLDNLKLVPLARPVNLKNESISVIKKFAPQAIFTGEFADTNKGTVALMRAPLSSVVRSNELVKPACIIIPNYMSGAETHLEHESKGNMFMHVADSAFNYSLLGLTGFETLGRLIDRCDCYTFTYSKLQEAITTFDELAAVNSSAC
jgi:HprK-related kinase A